MLFRQYADAHQRKYKFPLAKAPAWLEGWKAGTIIFHDMGFV